MFSVKALVGFLVRFVLVYGVLMAPWPGLEDAYANFFRTRGTAFFKSFGAKGVVNFQPASQSGSITVDTRIILGNRDLLDEKGNGPSGRGFTSSRYNSYLDTAFVIALILATPLSWQRKIWALLWGTILVHLFIIFKLWITILYGFNSFKNLGIIDLSPFWEQALKLTYQSFLENNLESGLVVAVIIWVLVVFRQEDWAMMKHQKELVKVETGKANN